MHPCISIIIPVFNLKDYIDKCIESIYSDDLPLEDFEVIAVNDGSTDNSLQLLQEAAGRHPNMRVLTQDNAGVSVARNRAIEEAVGDYLTFLDGDDLIAPNALSESVAELRKVNGADILYECAMVNNESRRVIHLPPQGAVVGQVYRITDFPSFRNGQGAAWGAFYRRGFLMDHDIRFAPGVANGEDTMFTFMLFMHNPAMVFSNVKLLLFTVREDSASHNASLTRADNLNRNIEYLLGVADRKDLTAMQREIVHAAIYQAINLAVDIYHRCNYLRGGLVSMRPKIAHMRGRLLVDRLPRLKTRFVPAGQGLKIKILNMSFTLYVILFKMKH